MRAVSLQGARLLGQGAHRRCYEHPLDASKCVKVIYRADHGSDRLDAIEIDYFRRLRRRLGDWRCLPRYFGPVDTDLGRGEVFEIVRSADGSPAESLKDAMLACQDAGRAADIARALAGLRDYIAANGIVTLPLMPQNILLKRDAAGELVPVLCDGLGDRRPLQASYWWPWERRRQQKKRWRAFTRCAPVREFLARFALALPGD
ncbi:MAG: hypothetical protein HUK26_02120 [Duodenibacillus sp.]|nr:hypothetical protein [Duodenibacillus sp.]